MKNFTDVESVPKKYYGFEGISQIILHCQFLEPRAFWLQSFFGPFLRAHGLEIGANKENKVQGSRYVLVC